MLQALRPVSPVHPRGVALPLLGRLALGAACFVGASCVAVVPYEARAGLVQEQSFEAVRRLLSEVSTRAINPHITTVEVTDEFFFYGWTETYLGPFYVPVTSSHQNQIFYANIGRIELYENHNVFIWGPGDQRVDKVLFARPEDAKTFIDCLVSLQAGKVR